MSKYKCIKSYVSFGGMFASSCMFTEGKVYSAIRVYNSGGICLVCDKGHVIAFGINRWPRYFEEEDDGLNFEIK
jgi:hypothetical protein